jgi:hypothetical protein
MWVEVYVVIKTPSCAIIVCCLLGVVQPLSAQGKKYIMMPHHDPSTPQGMEGGLWRTDANFESILQLKNVLINHPLTATPILYMADGTEYQLPPVTLDPAGVASININTAVNEMPAALAAHRSLYGMLGVKYNWSWPAMMGLVRNIDEAEMVSFYSNLHSDVNEVHSPSASQKPEQIESLWWQPYETTSGFVVLSNTLLTPVQVAIAGYDTSGNMMGQRAVSLASHASVRLALTDVLGRQPAVGATGSFKITYQGPDNGISAVGGLEDDTNGYSATLNLEEMHPEKARDLTVHQVVLDAAGVMIGEQAPAMQFPENTFFMPYGYLHNTSTQTRSVAVSATAAGSNGPQTYAIGTVTLAPHSTQQIDYKDLLKTFSIPLSGSMDISMSYQGHDGDVQVEEGSVDQSGNYVFEAQPQTEGWTISRTICHWELHDETNSMISLWNYSSTAEDLTLTLYYTGGQYVIPIHLEPKADYELDLATLIHSAQPDAAGTIIPQSITEGSAILADAHDQSNHIFVASNAGVFNVRTGTCGPTCQTCNGVSEITVVPGPIILAVTSTSQAQAQLTYNTGEVTSGTPYSWSSSNGAVTTVNSSGLVTGVGVGSDDIDDNFLNLPSPAGYICVVGNCPVYNGSGSGQASVQCGLNVATTSVTATSCQGQSSTSGVNAQITGGCLWTISQSSCTANNEQGQIDISSTPCQLNSALPSPNPPQAVVKYSAGPVGPPWPASGTKIGSFDVNFSIDIPSNSATENTTATGTVDVYCP